MEALPQKAELGEVSGSWCLKLLIGLMMLGALLRILRYLADRSLWLDECYLANSILTYSFKELLTRPLLYWQAAPPGFLLLQKLAVGSLGISEYALRIVPLLAGLASIPLFFGIVRRILVPTAQVLALALFVTLDPLIYYSAEAKQYGLDVTVALAILLTALRWREHPPGWRRPLALAAVGVLGIICSHSAIFTLAGVAIVLSIEFLRDRNYFPATLIGFIGLFWAGLFVLNYLEFLRPLMHHSGLTAYWAADYMPHDVLGAIKWLGASLYQLYSDYATMWLPLVDTAILATLIGLISFWRRDRGALALLLLPLLLTLGAAMVHGYPFGSRLVLFLVPSILILIGAGAAMIWESVLPGRRFIAALILLSIYLPTVARDVFYVIVPQKREEIRPVLAYIRDHRQPGDVLYVLYISEEPFRYYKNRFGMTPDRFGLADMPTIFGEPGEKDPSIYRTDLARLRGKGRVWVLITHPRALGGIDEEQLFPQILGQWGKPIDHVQAFNASATLYDMGFTH
jgi:hypothetical protein